MHFMFLCFFVVVIWLICDHMVNMILLILYRVVSLLTLEQSCHRIDMIENVKSTSHKAKHGRRISSRAITGFDAEACWPLNGPLFSPLNPLYSHCWPAHRAGLLRCNIFGQPGRVSKFPPFLWVKLWVGWVGRGYIEISRYFPALWISRVTLVTKIKLWYSLGY